MAHVQEKRWKFFIRIQDTLNSRAIAAGLDSDTDEFDLYVDLALTTRQTTEIKALAKDKNHYKILSTSKPFNYLPDKNSKFNTTVFDKLPFRIVRFSITDDSYETVVTNLDADSFPSEELKTLYNMRGK